MILHAAKLRPKRVYCCQSRAQRAGTSASSLPGVGVQSGGDGSALVVLHNRSNDCRCGCRAGGELDHAGFCVGSFVVPVMKLFRSAPGVSCPLQFRGPGIVGEAVISSNGNFSRGTENEPLRLCSSRVGDHSSLGTNQGKLRTNQPQLTPA